MRSPGSGSGKRRRPEEKPTVSEQGYRTLLTAAQRQMQERDLLDQVRTLLARGLELDTILNTAVEATARAFGYTHVSLYLLEGDRLVLQHQVGYEHPIRYVPITAGISGRVVRSGRPVLLADVRADPAFLAGNDGIVSEVCVPLRAQETVIGLFNLESTGQMVLGEADLRIALALSADIGIACERARLYAALRDSEERYRGIIETAPEGIWTIDAASNTTYVNAVMAELLGCSREEIIGKSSFTFIDDEHKSIAAAHLERRRQGITEQYDLKLRRKDGAPLWVILNATPQMDLHGNFAGALATVTDISERKQNEMQLRALVESAPDAMIISDRSGMIVLVNNQAVRLFGYTRDELEALTVDTLLPERCRATHAAHRAHYLTNPPTLAVGVGLELFALHKTGGEFPVEITLSPLEAPAGMLIIASVRDISERKRVEEALRQSDERFAGAFELAAIGMTIVSPEGRYLKVNRALCEMVGYAADELLGMTFQDITHPDDLASDLEHTRQVLAGEIQTYQLEKRYFHRSGAIVWVLLSVSLVRDNKANPLYFISQIQDINDRKREEQATLRRTAELGALNRMGQALSRLAEPASLLELIHTIIGQTLDNSNLYIALYDESSETISFPVYTVDGQRIARPARALGNGLTDCMIRTRQPVFLPRDVVSAAQQLGVEPQGRPARCYLGVPLLAGDKVIGAIAVQDYEREDVYDQGHLEMLRTIASQASIALENARLFAETHRRAEQLQAINDVERVVTTTLDPELLFRQIAQVLQARLNLHSVAVGLIEGEELVFKAMSGASGLGVFPAVRIKIGTEGVTGRVAAGGQTLLVPDVRLFPGFLPSVYYPHTLSELTVPLKTQAAIIGVLNIESDQLDDFSPELVALIETLASRIAIAIENARLFAETQQLARTDPLTGIPNRRYLFEVGARELSRARRFGHPLAALMLDIDVFKRVNDTYGHATGDQVLRTLSGSCQHHIRDVDTVGRYGGEEFVILLAETDRVGAQRVAERLREQVEHSAMETPQGPVSVTISVGVAERAESDDLTTLLARADQALYAAKQAGRNRVAVL
jgi:diguanylate cyclase (GGDEF)-like protein/PAS domain S-box-containing protein